MPRTLPLHIRLMLISAEKALRDEDLQPVGMPFETRRKLAKSHIDRANQYARDADLSNHERMAIARRGLGF